MMLQIYFRNTGNPSNKMMYVLVDIVVMVNLLQYFLQVANCDKIIYYLYYTIQNTRSFVRIKRIAKK